jgi:endonuclease IV
MMSEVILNIFLQIENGFVVAFKAKSYESDEGDEQKIEFLVEKSKSDFQTSFHFDAPTNKKGEFMKYNNFAKLEKSGMHFQLFEEIFAKFRVPENPLICVTPVVDGIILNNQ